MPSSKLPPFSIHTWKYGKDELQNKSTLRKALLTVFCTEHFKLYEVEQHRNFIYFQYFFYHHKITCAISENTYFSQSYIEDYHQRFFLGLSNYDRYSRRLHFFIKPPPSKYLNLKRKQKSIFLNKDKDPDLNEFWEPGNYIGYIYLRPLPTGLIGATILRPYDGEILQDGGRIKVREYPAQMDNSINIFGIKRSIPSLIYSSQDSIAGACATAALWCAFYKYADLFKTQILSHSNITSAGKIFSDEDRLFPNKGLSNLQIKGAIQQIGLECEIINNEKAYLRRPSLIKETVMAYLQCGIPIIFSFGFPDSDDYHAITICGYSHRGITAKKEAKFLYNKKRKDALQVRQYKICKVLCS